MAAITLPEAAKLDRQRGNTVRAAVIEIFAQRSPLLRVMPFEDIPGDSLSYDVEGALPGVAFRNVNEAFTPTTAVINPAHEALKIMGGEIQVDTFIQATRPNAAARHQIMQIKAMADKAQYTMIKGDNSANPKEFDGLERRLVIGGAQVIDNSAVDGGGALSIDKLNEAIDATEMPTHLLMLKKTARRITGWTNAAASVSQTRDEYSRPMTSWRGLPILEADAFGSTAALTNTEVSSGGSTATATSIYVLRLEPGYLAGIQNGAMRISEPGEMHSTPATLKRVQWFLSMYLPHPRADTRLRGILTSTAAVA